MSHVINARSNYSASCIALSTHWAISHNCLSCAQLRVVPNPQESSPLLMKQAHAHSGSTNLFDARKQGRVIQTSARPQQALSYRCRASAFKGRRCLLNQNSARLDARRSLTLQPWHRGVYSRLQATSPPASPMAKASVVPDWYKGDSSHLLTPWQSSEEQRCLLRLYEKCCENPFGREEFIVCSLVLAFCGCSALCSQMTHCTETCQ